LHIRGKQRLTISGIVTAYYDYRVESDTAADKKSIDGKRPSFSFDEAFGFGYAEI